MFAILLMQNKVKRREYGWWALAYVNLSDYKISKNWPEGQEIRAQRKNRPAAAGAARRAKPVAR
jgi:hypothetical protein